MKRIVLFLVTNLAVMLLLGLVTGFFLATPMLAERGKLHRKWRCRRGHRHKRARAQVVGHFKGGLHHDPAPVQRPAHRRPGREPPAERDADHAREMGGEVVGHEEEDVGAGGGLGNCRLGSGRQWLSWIGIDDLLDIYYRAAYDDRLTGPVNAVSPNPLRNNAYTKALAATVYGNLPSYAVPLFIRIVESLETTSVRLVELRQHRGGSPRTATWEATNLLTVASATEDGEFAIALLDPLPGLIMEAEPATAEPVAGSSGTPRSFANMRAERSPGPLWCDSGQKTYRFFAEPATFV